LLGITLLSEKAETLKELVKKTKDGITEEEFRIKAVTDANKRIEEQITNLKRRQTLWLSKHEEDLASLLVSYDNLDKIDIEGEILAHRDLSIWMDKKKQNDTHLSLVTRQDTWEQKHEKEVAQLVVTYEKLSHIDIESELQAHRDLAEHLAKTKELSDRDKEISRLQKDIDKEDKLINKLVEEIQSLKEHKCYACGQEFHDEQHSKVLADKEKTLEDSQFHATTLLNQWNELRQKEIFVIERPTTFYKTEAEAIRHSSELESILQQIEKKQGEISPYAEQIAANGIVELGPKPTTIYPTEAEAFEHRSSMAGVLQQLSAKQEETDPYAEQISEMQTQGVEDINYDVINELMVAKEHQEFLLKLLTNKDSFIRKRIIDQNLSYLNSRLGMYLDKIGLPHVVKFLSLIHI
jgi:hypothetical protein